jgi:hypothetical protein
MKKAAILLLIPILLAAVVGFQPAFAHTQVKVGKISVEAGWANEPPLQGQLNSITLAVSTLADGKPVANAFATADVTVKKGGETMPLDVRPGEKEGEYSAEILPTQVGQITVVVNGTIAGENLKNTEIKIEDVVDTKGISFPASGKSDSGVPQGFADQIRGVITDLTSQVQDAKSSAQEASSASQNATRASDEIRALADRSFLVGIVGVGVGVAGIAVAAIALSRKT